MKIVLWIGLGVAIAAVAIVSVLGLTTTQEAVVSADLQPITLPAPRTEGGRPLMDVLSNRASTRAFQPQPVPVDILSDLLWAAFGINRPDSGKRTAPSAINSQEIDIYVCLPEGVYVYNAVEHRLDPVMARDVRTLAGAAPYMKDAALELVYIADRSKLKSVIQPDAEMYSAAHSGFIGQNVYLYCASVGLGTVFHNSIDRKGLAEALQLRDDQAIVFAQAVGYPAGSP